jgi:AraC family transcriptional regulator
MAVTSHVLASGPGWQVNDTICNSGPQDKPFEEQHTAVSIAAVMQGSFQYRTQTGSTLLMPGSILLGNAGACFECGHEHGHGDRCLAFHFAPEFLDDLTEAGFPIFSVPGLPPLSRLVPILAVAEAMRQDSDAGAIEELALRIAGTVSVLLAPARRAFRQPSARDERRVTAAVRRIEAQAQEPLSLAELAREAAMSRYHFLRTFAQVVGMTPHQFLLRTRLHRAAVRLLRTDDAISTIAYDAGFNDLSTFNRRFRRLMGGSPGDFRARLTSHGSPRLTPPRAKAIS